MLGAILAAVSAVEAGVKGVSSIAGGLKGNASDQKRIAAAQSALDKALAGDSSQIAYMIQQRWHSATAVGKEAFRRALATYDSRFGSSYASAGDPATGAVAAPSPVQAVVQQTTDNVKRDLADGAQQILTGVTNAVTGKISPSAGTSFPFTKNQLYVGGALLLGLIFLPKLLHSHRA